MSRLIDALIKVVSQNQWPYQSIDAATLRLDIVGENGNWPAFARCMEEIDQVMVYSVCNHKASEPRRPVMAEFLTRANYGLRIGNFEMDFNDGEVRFKTSLHLRPDCPAEGMIEQALLDNALTMDHYLPGIMRVMFSDESALTIIQKVEGQG